MARYILSKNQIKRLIDGKSVIDGHGRKFVAGKELKETLQLIDKHNLYEKFVVLIENGEMDILKKMPQDSEV